MSNSEFNFKETSRFKDWCSKCTREGVPDNDTPCVKCIARSSGSNCDLPLFFLPKNDEPTKISCDTRFENWCTECVFAENTKSSEPCSDCEMMPKPAYVYIPTAFVDANQLAMWCVKCVHEYSEDEDATCESCIKYHESGTKPLYFKPQNSVTKGGSHV